MIDFSLPEDLRLVQETVRKFATEVVRPRAREWEKRRGVPDEARRRFHDLGFTLCDLPEAVGGMGMGLLASCLIQEELACGDPAAAVALWAPHLVPSAIIELGTPEQQARLLSTFAAWNARGAVAWSEIGRALPESGFGTVARREGEGWVLSGEKAFVVNGGRAELTVVFAQIDPAAGWEGAGAFVVVGAPAGMTAGSRCAWLGLEAVEAGSLRLDELRVPEEDRLAGDVVAKASRMFARGALLTAARQVGLAQAAYEYALAYAQDRVAFGKPVAHFQSISFTLAELAMEVEAARWMVWRAATAFDGGATEALRLVGEASVQANAAAWRSADDAVQILGGAGYVEDHPCEKWLRDTKVLALFSPGDQAQQRRVAAELLGQSPDELPSPWIQPTVT
jgi:alkylation response protein AidB-like acyl-CoA dehydrogenase